jgi:hypothetical protein
LRIRDRPGNTADKEATVKNVSWGLVLPVVLVLGLAPAPVEGMSGQIVVYFDSLGTQRADVPGGVGQLDTVFVFGEDIDLFVSGAQYRVDYGPNLQFVADLKLPPVTLGNSSAGISVGFGLLNPGPQMGKKFLIHWVLVQWQADGCTTLNTDFPVVEAHPLFPDPTPVVTEFGTEDEFPVFGGRSQLCQFVELDIRPGEWPNVFDSTLWDATSASDRKGGALAVAILGSATLDIADIDPASCRLEGVTPLTVGVADCACSDLGSDGFDDLFLQFLSRDVAAAIPRGNPGDTLTLTLAGAYNDGMPFSTSDRVVVVATDGGGSPSPPPPSPTVVLGLPSPNPFNPVTQIPYSVSVAQHVRLGVYDVVGRLLETLVDEVKAPGDYVIEWNAANLSSGVYFHRLQTASGTIVRRATLIK